LCASTYYVLYYFTVVAQEGPGRVIVHPGQNVELSCDLPSNLTSDLTSDFQIAWLVNISGLMEDEGHMGAGVYSLPQLKNDILANHSVNGNKIIVENITMNDGRNDSVYRCVIVQGMLMLSNIQNKSDPIKLYVAGEYRYNM